MTRLLSLLVALTLSAPAVAQAPPVRVSLQTSEGAIVVELDAAHAPVTTANFLRYVDQKRFDGAVFYRAMKIGADGGLIQGGTNNDPKRVLPPVAHEPTSATGLRHTDGTLSMARYAPGTATGDFFITLGAAPFLDASAADPGFAAFGHVVAGMDVVKRILAAPVSATRGEGVMRGQMIEAPVAIVAARRTP
ncbi:MAG: peptidylprolyl isomerase [Sphingomonadaceae bacterium]|nr:peptidylprolyl isomerase [Sphingomonadaceae bacterium]